MEIFSFERNLSPFAKRNLYTQTQIKIKRKSLHLTSKKRCWLLISTRKFDKQDEMVEMGLWASPGDELQHCE